MSVARVHTKRKFLEKATKAFSLFFAMNSFIICLQVFNAVEREEDQVPTGCLETKHPSHVKRSEKQSLCVCVFSRRHQIVIFRCRDDITTAIPFPPPAEWLDCGECYRKSVLSGEKSLRWCLLGMSQLPLYPSVFLSVLSKSRTHSCCFVRKRFQVPRLRGSREGGRG